MKLRYIESKDCEITRPLWKSCFPEDSKGFLYYYYSEKTKDNRILVLEDGEEVISMLHRNPYTVAVRGKEIAVDYIVAVATKKEYRGQGCMRKILTQCLNDMHNEGQPFTFLMPAAEAIYYPYDFRYATDVRQCSVRPELLEMPGEIVMQQIFLDDISDQNCEPEFGALIANKSLHEMTTFMEQWFSRHFEIYAKRDTAYVSRLMKELQSEGGEVFFVKHHQQTKGLFAQWGLEKKEQRFLYADDEISEVTEIKPLMMVRITNIISFLELFRTKTGSVEFILNVSDDFIEGNNGLIFWTLNEDGAEVFLKHKENADKKSVLSVTVAQLVLWLFAREAPENIWKNVSKEQLRKMEQVKIFNQCYFDEVV